MFSQFSRSVLSDSLQPHESQHTRPPCPSPTPGVQSDSRPLSHWCHPAISTSVLPFSCSRQSLPASESFPMNQRFAWGGQSTGVSALASFLPKKFQGWSPSEWTGWISVPSRDSQESSPTPEFTTPGLSFTEYIVFPLNFYSLGGPSVWILLFLMVSGTLETLTRYVLTEKKREWTVSCLTHVSRTSLPSLVKFTMGWVVIFMVSFLSSR